MIPRPFKKLIRSTLNAARKKRAGPFDRPYYQRISDEDVVLGRV
jgi:hypothetical protein